LPAFALETLAYLITLVYAYRNSYPFSTYGENLFLTIQNVAITLLIIHYFPTAQGGLTTKRARSNTPVVAMAAFIALVAALVLLRVPMSLMRLLQLATVPISLFSKVPQITENYRNQSTGQLSVFAVTSQVFGCLARVFTTMTEMEDSLVLAGFVLALILNTVLAFQIYTYWGQTVPVSSKEDMRRSEKQSLPSVPHQPAEFPAHQQPAFIHANTPVQSSGGRRWARKVD
jgi:mannose-P-dolichol utilization defect protein 1